jgi:hypothetical protein
LLPALGRAGQSELLAQTNDLRSEIVIAGLPDEGEPLCAALLAAIQPRVVVVVDSEFPAGRRASRALMARLEGARIPVLYTRTVGAVKIVSNRTGWRVEIRDPDGDWRRMEEGDHSDPGFVPPRRLDGRHSKVGTAGGTGHAPDPRVAGDTGHSMASKIKILLVHDHPLVRESRTNLMQPELHLANATAFVRAAMERRADHPESQSVKTARSNPPARAGNCESG